jgi:hypothetical protein
VQGVAQLFGDDDAAGFVDRDNGRHDGILPSEMPLPILSLIFFRLLGNLEGGLSIYWRGEWRCIRFGWLSMQRRIHW